MKALRALVLGYLRLFMFGYASSAVFYGVYGVVFAIFFYNSIFEADEFLFLSDVVLVAFVQVVGLGFNKYNFANPLRSDPYTRLMRVLRILPVRTEQLAAARLILCLSGDWIRRSCILLRRFDLHCLQPCCNDCPEHQWLPYIRTTDETSSGRDKSVCVRRFGSRRSANLVWHLASHVPQAGRERLL